MALSESTIDASAPSWFTELGHVVAHARHLAPGKIAERNSFADVVLVSRFRSAARKLNAAISDGTREDAGGEMLRHKAPSLLGNKRALHGICHL